VGNWHSLLVFFLGVSFRVITHYIDVEVALAGHGFVALSGVMSVLRWRSKRRSAQKLTDRIRQTAIDAPSSAKRVGTQTLLWHSVSAYSFD